MPETAVSQTECHSYNSTASCPHRLRSAVTLAWIGTSIRRRQRVSISGHWSQVICLSTVILTRRIGSIWPKRLDANGL